MTSPIVSADVSAGTGLAAGEYWIELVPASPTAQHQVSFPAVIEPHRHHGPWVRPRLRPGIAQSLCEWLNLVYPSDPDWYPLARLDGDQLIVLTGDSAHHRHQIALDGDGRYPLGDLGRWYLSGPTRTPARLQHGQDILRDLERRSPHSGEVTVTCGPDNQPTSGFPARVDTSPRAGACVPVFRPDVAEAVAATCNRNHDTLPEDYPQVYFDGDTLLHVHPLLRARDGYLPARIEPDDNGHYRIDTPEWTFRTVPEKSEGPRIPGSRGACSPAALPALSSPRRRSARRTDSTGPDQRPGPVTSGDT